MKLRIGKPSSLMSWVVTAALITSPLLAQNPPAADVTLSTPDDVSPDAAPQVTKENDQPIVDTSVLLESPSAASEPAVPVVNKSSIPSTPARAETHPSGTSGTSAPGETKWVILAAILTAGAVAAILLLRGGGGDSNHHPGSQGTIIVAGSPSVSNH